MSFCPLPEQTPTGNSQSNWLDGGAGIDIIDGGDGTDVLYFDKTTAGVTVDLAAGTGLGGDADGDTYSNIEVVIGTDSVDNFKAWQGSGMSFAGGEGEDTFEVLLAGINNKVNACVAVQSEVISIVKEMLTIATIPLQPQFSARLNAREIATKRAA